MFWYYWTYMAAIYKKLQTNEQLKRCLTNPNRNFNETNEWAKVSSDMKITTTYEKINIRQWQENNIPN